MVRSARSARVVIIRFGDIVRRPKSLDQIMADMAAQGITVSVSTRDVTSVSGRIGQAAKDAGIYWCVICGGGAGHDSDGHEPQVASKGDKS
jgi:hypothetical protein